MKNFKNVFFFFFIFIVSCKSDELILVKDLQVDYVTTPIGIDRSTPSLSWQIECSREEVTQKAYQIFVASSPGLLTETDADVWNSGKIESGKSTGVAYKGKTLVSGKRYFWKVKVWDQSNQIHDSDFSWWESGLLASDDWEARWISGVESYDSVPPLLPSPYFRKAFKVERDVQKARLYVSGLGYYEAFLNGEKVGDHVLDPAVTRYDKRVKYVTYDVTDLIRKGENVMGAVLGNGWYNQHTRAAWDFNQAPWRDAPVLRSQLEMVYSDGQKKVLNSDNSWKFTHQGPITFNGIHNGVHYDARLELKGWSDSGYDDTSWEQAHEVEGPSGQMSAQIMPPIRVIEQIEPVDHWRVNDSTMMYDVGQNITGWARIRAKGPEGSTIKIRYGERIYDDGTLDQEEISRFVFTGETQTNYYTLKGKGIEQWHPVFTYHGFQYIEVSTSDPGIQVEEVLADVVHTDLHEHGYFRCSNDMFNQVYENMKWSYLGNFHGYPTDCPHREKIGWSGDAQLVAEAGLFTFDVIPAYLKWMDDFKDEQREDGRLPGIIPTSGWGYTHGKDNHPGGYGPQWEGVFMEIPWQMYLFTGDTAIIDRYYSSFTRYVDHLEAYSEDFLLNYGIDDHKQLEPLTDGPYLSSAFFYYFSDMMSEMAAITGKKEDQEKYDRLAEKVKTAFNQRYYDSGNAVYAHGGQTPMALALYLGLVEEENREQVFQNLLAEIDRKDGHIDAGVLGTKAVLNVLIEHGEDQVIYEMADKREFPGWGYWIDELGATTLFQNWDGSQSRNHIMFGSIADYFYKGLAGIRPEKESSGFKHFAIKPMIDNDISNVEAGFESVHGLISSHWEKTEDAFVLDVSIPANTSARVLVPVRDNGSVRVNGQEPDEKDFEVHPDGYHVFEVGSGQYHFVVEGFFEEL